MTDPIEPVFVDRKTAAAKLMISVETFDLWVRQGFVPRAHIQHGQIYRWHWPSLEKKLAGEDKPKPDEGREWKLPERTPEEQARIDRRVARKKAKTALRATFGQYDGPPWLGRRKAARAPQGDLTTRIPARPRSRGR